MKNLIQLVAAMQLPEDRGNGMSHGTIVASNDSSFSAGNASVELTQFSQALVDSAQLERELEIVAPSVPAARKFTWRKHDDAADFQTEGDDVRAIGAPFKQVKSTGTEENGRTLNKGLTVILDNDEMLPGDEERWAGRLTRRIFRNDLVRAVQVGAGCQRLPRRGLGAARGGKCGSAGWRHEAAGGCPVPSGRL